jgi:hypothetical protein
LYQHLDALFKDAERSRQYELDVTRRTAQYLQRVDAMGATLEQASQQELSQLLGVPVTRWLTGQQLLEDRILHGGALDHSALLNYFYRHCKRHLHLLGPALRELDGVSVEWGDRA